MYNFDLLLRSVPSLQLVRRQIGLKATKPDALLSASVFVIPRGVCVPRCPVQDSGTVLKCVKSEQYSMVEVH